jgi:NADP-dependent 3-hydroxy acid dehydrogenase YdfG
VQVWLRRGASRTSSDRQTVIVIGGSSGDGFETARRAGTEGAKVIITGRDATRPRNAADEVGALDAIAFDARDPDALYRFFQALPKSFDHLMVTAGGPYN